MLMKTQPDDDLLRMVWSQKDVPVALRRSGPGEKIRVRLPFDRDNRKWIRNGRSRDIEWNTRFWCWELPKAWFNDFVDRALLKYGAVWIVQPYREKEICATACLNAVGHVCNCSCMGMNHGHGDDGTWFEVGEAFAVRWGKRRLACRYLELAK